MGTLSVVDLGSSEMKLAACIDSSSASSCSFCTAAGGCNDYSEQNLLGVALDGTGKVLVVDNSRFGIFSCQVSSLSTIASCAYTIGQDVGFQYVEDTFSGTSNFATAGSWNDDPPLSAGFISPWGLAFDAALSTPALFVSDGNAIRRVDFDYATASTPTNVVTLAGDNTKTLPGKGSLAWPQHWVSPGPNQLMQPAAAFVNGVGSASSFDKPNVLVAVHATRIVYIADRDNHAIRSMTY